MTSSLKVVIMSLHTRVTSLKDVITSFTVIITSLQTHNYELECRDYLYYNSGRSSVCLSVCLSVCH